MRLAYGVGTRQGAVRRVNEDGVLAEPPVFVVADGMGGHDAGDVASRIVVREFAALAHQPRIEPADVHRALTAADRDVRAIPRGARSGRGSAGSTVAGVVALDQAGHDYWLVLNVGDSRVYRVDGERLEQVSVDHSVVQELVDAGQLDTESARHHAERNVVTRAIGSPGGLEPDYWLLPVAAGSRLLICSDGLTGVLVDAEVHEVLTQYPDPQEAVDSLLRAVSARGGRDDVSAVVVDVLAGSSEHPTDVTTPRSGVLPS